MDGTTFEFRSVFRKLVLFYCNVPLVIYWVIVMAHQGWHYYQRSRERELQASALATELVRTRLEVLRMQLNPHFLFNTLHAISALIHEQPDDADRIVARLSELLRVSLEQTDAQEVPLRQELAFLERYLEIEHTRFQDRLAVEMEVETGLDDGLVPSLILQPLVENAIRHGIEPREDTGRVKVTARRLEGMLELKVSDNGPGLPETEVALCREGVGLSNTRSRLAHLYGAKHQLELTPAAGGGLEVKLLLPCRTEVPECQPKVVIVVTAYDQYALQAFEVHAIDYLLKPFDRERFQKSLCHAREQLRRGESGVSEKRLAALLENLRPNASRPDRLAVKANGRVVFVRVEEIDW